MIPVNSYVFSHWCLCLTLCGLVFFFSRLLYFYDFLSHLLSSLFYGIPMSNTHLTIVLSSKIYTFCVFIMLRTHQKYPKYICFNGTHTPTTISYTQHYLQKICVILGSIDVWHVYISVWQLFNEHAPHRNRHHLWDNFWIFTLFSSALTVKSVISLSNAVLQLWYGVFLLIL